MTKEENTAGDVTVHYNPETECVLQTFEDGTVVDLTELFDPDVIWATYYEGRIWYSVGSIYSINSCLIDGTDGIRHPINYDLEILMKKAENIKLLLEFCMLLPILSR